MAASNNQIVELNVGGTAYSTTALTLTRAFPTSKLAVAVRAFITGKDEAPEGVEFLRDSNQRMFIDRDGASFRYVLDFLRNGGGASGQSESILKTCPDVRERQKIRTEAEFYGLGELVSVLKKLEARQIFIGKQGDRPKPVGSEDRSTAGSLLYPRLYQGPAPISRNEGDSPCRSLDRVMSTGSLSQNRPFFITIGYRSSCSATRDTTSLEKFRRITRITVSGRSDIAKEVFRDDLNDSRDPDRYPSDGYTCRYYLKHNYLEHAFETLASRGFLLNTSCSSGSKTLPAQAKEYKQWTTYIEYVFCRPPWDE